MTKTVLIGVDGSDPGSRAIAFAADVARQSDSRLLIAYIIEWSPFTFNTPEENEVRHKRRDEELSRAHTEIVAPLLAALKDQGIEAEGLVRHGKPAEALAHIALDRKAAQIVVGRRGQSKVAGMLFGSSTGSLLQIAPVPVTVVP